MTANEGRERSLQKKLSGVETNGNKVLSMDRNKNIYCALVMAASKVAAPTFFFVEAFYSYANI